MPKEGESSTQGGKPVLKRGDACLYCRKRRIRCSADKPSCQHCKGKRECIYDNGKPISRVRQLEDKVAQLEGLLKGDTGGEESRRPSGDDSTMGSGGLGHPPLIHHSSSNQTSSSQNSGGMGDTDMSQSRGQSGDQNAMFGGMGMGMEGMEGFDMLQQTFGDITGDSGFSNDLFHFGGMMFGGTNDQSSRLPDVVADSLPQDPTTMFDFSSLDPNFMSLVNSFGSTLQNPTPSFQTQSQPSTGPTQQFSVQPTPQSFAPSTSSTQPQSSFTGANTVSDQSTGLTPFLNPDYTSPPADSSNPSPLTSGYAAAADLAPTPGHHFEHLSKSVSYNAHGGHLPTAAEANGTATVLPYPTTQPWMSEVPEEERGRSGIETLLSQSLGDKSPENPPTMSSGGQKFSDTFQYPTDTRGGRGTDLGEEGYELVGGWFDANDLPRVARDHLYVRFALNGGGLCAMARADEADSTSSSRG